MRRPIEVCKLGLVTQPSSGLRALRTSLQKELTAGAAAKEHQKVP